MRRNLPGRAARSRPAPRQPCAPRRRGAGRLLLLLALGSISGGVLQAGEEVAGPDGAARVGALRRYAVVHRRQGEPISGILVLQGPRGVVVAVTQGESLEVFVPAAEVERIETRAEPPEDQQAQGDAVTRYVAEPRAGALTLTGITGGEPPRKRPAAAKAPWLDKEGGEEGKETGDDEGAAATGPVLPRGLPTLGRTDKVLRDEDDAAEDEDEDDGGDLNLFGQQEPDADETEDEDEED